MEASRKPQVENLGKCCSNRRGVLYNCSFGGVNGKNKLAKEGRWCGGWTSKNLKKPDTSTLNKIMACIGWTPDNPNI